jgi:hypothetical protein
MKVRTKTWGEVSVRYERDEQGREWLRPLDALRYGKFQQPIACLLPRDLESPGDWDAAIDAELAGLDEMPQAEPCATAHPDAEAKAQAARDRMAKARAARGKNKETPE